MCIYICPQTAMPYEEVIGSNHTVFLRAKYICVLSFKPSINSSSFLSTGIVRGYMYRHTGQDAWTLSFVLPWLSAGHDEMHDMRCMTHGSGWCCCLFGESMTCSRIDKHHSRFQQRVFVSDDILLTVLKKAPT